MARNVIFVSDRTGLTAEGYGSTLLSQFENEEFESQRLTFVDSEEKARDAAQLIEEKTNASGKQVIVFSTLVDLKLQSIINDTSACVISLFEAFISPLEACLGQESAHKRGVSFGAVDTASYQKRLDAIDYTLAHDDGVRVDQYDKAKVIFLGVSRCGKTPVSLYLAINYSIKAANYPITDDDLLRETIPEFLRPLKDRLVGLTIDPRQLSRIREQRRPGSDYAALSVCRKEVRAVETMFANAGIPVFDSTDTSIEELSGNVIESFVGYQ